MSITTSDLRPAGGGIILPRAGALTVAFPLTNTNGTPYTGLSGTLDLYVKLAGSGKLALTLDDSQASVGLLSGTLTGLQSAQLAEGRTYPLLLVQQEGEEDEWQIAAVDLIIARKGQGNSGSVTSATQPVQVVSGGSVIQTTVLAGPTVTINNSGGGGGGGDFDGTQTFTAGAALSGHRVVTLNSIGRAIYCDAATLAHAGRAIGLTTGAASSGAAATIQMPGWEITESGWAWDTTKPVFVGLNGALTQTIPTLAGGFAFLQVIGWPVTSTKLLINPGEPVTL